MRCTIKRALARHDEFAAPVDEPLYVLILRKEKINTLPSRYRELEMALRAFQHNARMTAEESMKRMHQGLLALLLGAQIALAAPAPAAKHKTVYDYSLVSLDGKVVSLATYKGKVILIVNLASKSIYNSQLAALEDLQKTYAEKGLVILGIPSTDFGAEELTDNAAIQKYYLETAHLTFPVFSKTALRGKDAIPLVHFLTDPKDGTAGGDIHWNYTKFVVDREGKPVLRCGTDVDPADPEFRVKLEQILAGTYKKQDSPGKEPAPSGSDEDDEDGGA